MNTSKIGVLFLVTAMALAGIGTSFAMWSETITIQGSVSPGSLDIKWSYDDCGKDDDYKDISTINAYIDDDQGSDTYGNLVITIGNAYPCVTYWVDFDIESLGTVPVHFDNGFVSDPAYLLDEDIITITPTQGCPEITDAQLHDDDHWYGRLSFHITNELWDDFLYPNGWRQGATHTFTIDIMGHQYNECPPPTNEKVVDLPDCPINFKIWLLDYPSDLYTCMSEAYNIPAGDYNIENGGQYVTWCADEEPQILVGTHYGNAQHYTATLYSSYDPANPYPDEDWDKVNWIINHRNDPAYAGITGQGVQEAIWYFVNGGNEPTTPLGIQLRDDADANGEGFVPGPGEWCAVVVIVGGDVQTIFWEVDP